MNRREDLEEKLRGDVEAAIERYKHARESFSASMSDLPGSVAALDESVQSQEQEVALRELKAALQRLHNLVVGANSPSTLP